MAQKRKSLGKSTRFKVFDRDGFTCQYCGSKPPKVVLEVDHIVPVAKGGKDEIENLLTACKGCNGGKSARPLGSTPKQVKVNIAEIAERQEQMTEFYKHQQKLEQLKKKQLDKLDGFWGSMWPGGPWLTDRQRQSLSYFLKFFSVMEIQDAMFTSTKLDDEEDGFRYMCGILHKKRREQYGEE